MKIAYKAKTLIDGYKIGSAFAGKRMIAVPFRKVLPGKMVAHGNDVMLIPADPLKVITHQDKFGRGQHILYYYEFKPIKLWE